MCDLPSADISRERLAVLVASLPPTTVLPHMLGILGAMDAVSTENRAPALRVRSSSRAALTAASVSGIPLAAAMAASSSCEALGGGRPGWGGSWLEAVAPIPVAAAGKAAEAGLHAEGDEDAAAGVAVTAAVWGLDGAPPGRAPTVGSPRVAVVGCSAGDACATWGAPWEPPVASGGVASLTKAL